MYILFYVYEDLNFMTLYNYKFSNLQHVFPPACFGYISKGMCVYLFLTFVYFPFSKHKFNKHV